MIVREDECHKQSSPCIELILIQNTFKVRSYEWRHHVLVQNRTLQYETRHEVNPKPNNFPWKHNALHSTLAYSDDIHLTCLVLSMPSLIFFLMPDDLQNAALSYDIFG